MASADQVDSLCLHSHIAENLRPCRTPRTTATPYTAGPPWLTNFGARGAIPTALTFLWYPDDVVFSY